jgi:DNA-binding LacI/PurR family transcriptional regulator
MLPFQNSLTSAQKPCAIFCPSDVYAIQAFHIISDNMIKNVKIFGFDKSKLLIKGRFNIKFIQYNQSELVKKLYYALNHSNETACEYIPFSISKKEKRTTYYEI